jgi:hypothetical protein
MEFLTLFLDDRIDAKHPCVHLYTGPLVTKKSSGCAKARYLLSALYTNEELVEAENLIDDGFTLQECTAAEEKDFRKLVTLVCQIILRLMMTFPRTTNRRILNLKTCL